MAVHVHFTPRVEAAHGARAPHLAATSAAAGLLLVVVSVGLLCTRIGGLVAFALVLTAGTGAFCTGLTMGRRPADVQRSNSRIVSELRTRVGVQARMPDLPHGWHVDSAVRAAPGQRFSGDFVAGNRTDERHLEVALVDVSGHGEEAGSRSMLMSGATSGLLGPVPPEEFLPAANDYVMRQGWDDGFATAVHVWVDLESGAYSVGSAGHPAAAHFHSATRSWSLIRGAGGTCLGVLEGQQARDYPRAEGELKPGDALLLYTDGLVETRDQTHDDELQRVLRHSGARPTAHGAANRICTLARGDVEDDRSVVLLCRD